MWAIGNGFNIVSTAVIMLSQLCGRRRYVTADVQHATAAGAAYITGTALYGRR
jgi:hypothetical protein